MTPEIYPPFRDELPPLTPEQLDKLETELVAEGCRDPLVVWRGRLIDGHNRLEICTRLGIPCSFVDYTNSPLLPDEESVINWIGQSQTAKRNLTPDGLSYFRAKEYAFALSRRRPDGQCDRAVDSGRFAGQVGAAGETRSVVAAGRGVSARTISRDLDRMRSIDAITATAGLPTRNAILTGKLKLSRRVLAEVATKQPSSLEQATEFGSLCRQTRPSDRRHDDDVRPHFQRTIKSWVRDSTGTIVGAVLSICGHEVKCKTRKGDTSGRKTMACVRCGSGCRPAWEKKRQRLNLERMIDEAWKTPRGRIAITDLVDAAIGVLTVPPQTEQQQELWGRIDHAMQVTRLVPSPYEDVR